MNRRTSLLLLAFCACSMPKQVELPYATGIHNITWGTTRAGVDSVIAADTGWTYISSIVNSTNGRQIMVVQRQAREYYLEFDTEGRLFLVNYISDHADLDTVMAVLTRSYGSPVVVDTSAQGSFIRNIWQEEMPEGRLEFELMVTKKSYSFVAKKSDG